MKKKIFISLLIIYVPFLLVIPDTIKVARWGTNGGSFGALYLYCLWPISLIILTIIFYPILFEVMFRIIRPALKEYIKYYKMLIISIVNSVFFGIVFCLGLNDVFDDATALLAVALVFSLAILSLIYSFYFRKFFFQDRNSAYKLGVISAVVGFLFFGLTLGVVMMTYYIVKTIS